MRDRAAAEPGLRLRSISDRHPVAIPVRAARSRTDAEMGSKRDDRVLALHDGQRHLVRDAAPIICVARGYLILKRFLLGEQGFVLRFGHGGVGCHGSMPSTQFGRKQWSLNRPTTIWFSPGPAEFADGGS